MMAGSAYSQTDSTEMKTRKLKEVTISKKKLATIILPTDYREGFIVTSNKDTVKGWIAYDEGMTTYDKCVFKPSLEGEAKVCRALMIEASVRD